MIKIKYVLSTFPQITSTNVNYDFFYFHPNLFYPNVMTHPLFIERQEQCVNGLSGINTDS